MPQTELPASCWCHKTVQMVPAEIIRQGGTYACRSVHCQRRYERWIQEGTP